MKKTFIILISLFALLSSCTDTPNLESLSMGYVTPEYGVIPASGGEITISATSTHSFQMTSNSTAFSFLKDGIVKFNKEGVALVTTTHLINVTPNETGAERQLTIIATHLQNPDITASLRFVQPAQEEDEEDSPEDSNLPGE